MIAIPESLLKRIEDWCTAHPTGQIVLNVAEHQVKSYEFRERGHIQADASIPRVESPQWSTNHSGHFLDGKVTEA